MTFRCINAFAFGGEVYPNGFEADAGDPILKSHGAHFVEVERGVGRAVEQAVAEPGGLRASSAPKKAAGQKPAMKPAGPKSEAGDSKEETGS